MGNEPDLKSNPAYGPYLNAAFLCEKVLEQKDGVLSAIRIVDRITHSYTASAEDPSSNIPTAKAEFSFLLILKSGQNPGVTNIKIIPKKPDNSELPPLNSTMHLDPPDNRGANLVFNATITLDQQGGLVVRGLYKRCVENKDPTGSYFLAASYAISACAYVVREGARFSVSKEV